MFLKNRKAMGWLLLTIGFMTLICLKSSEPYQQQDLRPSLAAWIPVSFLEKWLPHVEFHYDRDLISWKNPYDMLEFLIRKTAHVTEYALLMFLWMHTLFAFHLNRSRTLRFATAITLLYAATDEWHQTFVANRTGHGIDVAVDAIGVGLVLCCYMLRPSRNRS